MLDDFIALLMFAIANTLTPGPNNLMLLSSSMNFGVKKTLPHYLGICIGCPAMILIVALGLGAIFMEYSWIQSILKVLGSIYMLYLAWQILTSHNKTNASQTRKPVSFLQALLFQWINPKAWLMAVGTVSIFTLSNNYLTNALIIGVVYFIMCIPCTGAWLLGGKLLQRILKKDSHRIWFNIVMALGLVAAVGMIVFD